MEVHITWFDKFIPWARRSKLASLESLYSNLEPLSEMPVPDAVSRQLYETIARDARCECNDSSPDSVRLLEGRLRLIEKIGNDWANDYVFDTVFIAPADMHQYEPLRCQLMRFHIPTYESL